jgi:hypothetical protein
VPDDPALIWEKHAEDRPRPEAAAQSSSPAPTAPPDLVGESIPLREAHRRFGVAVSTLRSWVKAGKIDGAMEEGRWMVAPASIAAHLSAKRRGGTRPAPSKPEPAAAPAPTPSPPAPAATGPTSDSGAMLVPRDAWDKLMDQLGNLHEAGQQLAEARERAAKAETEAGFLRERLGEMREERDVLRQRVDGGSPPSPGPTGGLISRVRRALWGDR